MRFLAGVTEPAIRRIKNYAPAESAPESSLTASRHGVAKSLVFDSLGKMTEDKIYIINVAALSQINLLLQATILPQSSTSHLPTFNLIPVFASHVLPLHLNYRAKFDSFSYK